MSNTSGTFSYGPWVSLPENGNLSLFKEMGIIADLYYFYTGVDGSLKVECFMYGLVAGKAEIIDKDVDYIDGDEPDYLKPAFDNLRAGVEVPWVDIYKCFKSMYHSKPNLENADWEDACRFYEGGIWPAFSKKMTEIESLEKGGRNL